MVNNVRAAASLMRLSPVRIAITRFGRPSLRPTATAVTGSGGATIAPRTSAVANVNGTKTNHDDTAATVNAVTTTSPMPRPRIGRTLRKNVGNEKSSAAEYKSGGNTTVSRMCASSSGVSNPGRNDTAAPMTTMIRAGSRPAAMGDGGDHDGADDDEYQFHPPIVASGLTFGRSGTKTDCGPPAPRYGSPCRRFDMDRRPAGTRRCGAGWVHTTATRGHPPGAPRRS